MIKTRTLGLLRSLRRGFSGQQPRVQFIGGTSELVSNPRDVQLRGIRIQGNHSDLPNLIFFPDLFDQVENWVPYFTNPQNGILNYRNVYLLYPRNFGSSDWCNDTSNEHGENVAEDIERFMYQHKITMATLGGHGFGAKNAMVLGTYRPHLVTGILSYDYAPQDYTYFRAAATLRELAKSIGNLAGKPFPKSEFEKVANSVASKKLQSVLSQNLKQVSLRDFNVKFNAPFVASQFDELINWKRIEYGLFTGRVCFLFPDYSNYVFLNSNTNSIMRVCPKAQGFFHDIQMVMTDNDNPELNHWIYEYPELAADFMKQSVRFLSQYDGVDVRMMNRIEYLEGHTVPVRGSRERKDYYGGSISPPHFYHNWRFSPREDLK